jgi:hypothetical protein
MHLTEMISQLVNKNRQTIDGGGGGEREARKGKSRESPGGNKERGQPPARQEMGGGSRKKTKNIRLSRMKTPSPPEAQSADVQQVQRDNEEEEEKRMLAMLRELKQSEVRDEATTLEKLLCDPLFRRLKVREEAREQASGFRRHRATSSSPLRGRQLAVSFSKEGKEAID